MTSVAFLSVSIVTLHVPLPLLRENPLQSGHIIYFLYCTHSYQFGVVEFSIVELDMGGI